MFCYNCGCNLSGHDFCTACGADVTVYKKVMYASNKFYNDGLEKAQVRDLSGAIVSLRQSLKFNKGNIEARNLLGLVYFEVGEVVAALSEWVISKNMRPEKNIADDYISMLQSNPSRLEDINQTIKKYNQAYMYCLQDGKDLAIIQLKKVLSLNSKFVRAHQLLALLYIDSEDFEKARRELNKCMDIDRNNTLTLRYLKEVDAAQLPQDEGIRSNVKNKKKEDVIRYQSDNEIIIQPGNVKEQRSGGISTLVNIAIGLIIGVAATYYLFVPAAVNKARTEVRNETSQIAAASDEKTIEIQELQAKVASLEKTNETLQNTVREYEGEGGTLEGINVLLEAASEYLRSGDSVVTAEILEPLGDADAISGMSVEFNDLYIALMSAIGPNMATDLYNAGFEAYRREDFPTAIELFEKAAKYDAENVDLWFYLGQAFAKNSNFDEAITAYSRVIELAPGKERANKAQQYIDAIQSAR